MLNTRVFLAIFIFLFSGVLASAFVFRTAGAAGTIYIRADGSIDPPIAPIMTSDNATYTLTDNVNASIVMERDFIVFDGAGYSVQGNDAPNSRGISLEMRKNVTLHNLNLKRFNYCIWLYACENVTISQNNITNNVAAINFHGSSHNTVSENNITENSAWGILLSDSSFNVFRNNTLTNNENSLYLGSTDYSQLRSLDIDVSNRINGKPIYYWMDKQDQTVPGDAGFVALLGSKNMRVENLTLTNNQPGILLECTCNSTLRGNNITNNEIGIAFHMSSNNTISENNIANNWNGVFLDADSSQNRIFCNNFINNSIQARSYDSSNLWDNDVEGNHWSDYVGNDSNNDGIGDTPYTLDTTIIDRYPLIAPCNPLTQLYTFYLGTWGSVPYYAKIASNSTVSDFTFDAYERTMSFNVSDDFLATGYCRLVFKNALLEGPYVLRVDTMVVSPTITTNGTHSFLYFSYLQSPHNIRIMGTGAIPETSVLATTLSMVVTLMAVIIYREKHRFAK